ncbi:hypothetical protein BDA96_07G003700 [Sorghum bicolor]|uniref:Uncharacterized protein n=1 Tax=Sorghum bicolor TaxID=4558 RepID=A0A921QJR8_SORBI|nr:hypothetical protein BDA96_07G003700 [Sorghum bicolor]
MGHVHGHHEPLLQAKYPPQAALVVSVLLVVCALLVRRRFGTTTTLSTAREQLLSKLPSPPRRLPIIGHLHLIGSLPHVSLRDLAARHGRHGLMLLHLGAVPTLVVSSPSAAQAVLRTQDHIFASRAYSPATDILFYGSTGIAFSPYGQHWRQVKKIVTTHLLTNKKVRSYRHAREHEVMFEAGTDTSFIVLEYAMAHLMQTPCLMNKLQTEAVIKETLRLHMPAPLLLPHLSMADCNIEGYTIPSGTRAIVNSWALARDPSYWENANEFMPERFMEGGSAAAMDNKGNDFQYLPFGAGRRMCPGINFASSTIEVMLVNLVYHFNWELPVELSKKGIDMTELFGVTVRRMEKLLLVPIAPQD